MNKAFSTLKFLIGWPLAILAIVFLIKLTLPNLSVVAKRLDTVNYWVVLLSIAIFLIYFILRAILWKTILHYKGYDVNLKKTSYLWEISEFKRYVPGNIWSFLSRVAVFSDVGVDKKVAGLALLDEVQLLIIGSAIVSIIAIPLMLGTGESSELLWQMSLIFILSAVGIIIYSLTVALIFKLRGNKQFIKNLFLPGYTLQQKLILTILAVITFFSFGAASLVACLAIFTFNIVLYLELSAFFTFAFLAGYLSFITPMGLGVREGVITLGLTRFTNLSLAGFLSIFSRVILIIAEIIFLLIVFTLEIVNRRRG
jgi:uncharacterized membrane protein YbhN (UPF0104 family)